MGPKQRREREKEEVKQRILDVARELFVEQGYEAVSMRKIAERIEYSPTAIYLHFQDKEALLEELCGNDFRALAREFIVFAQIRDPLERLRASGMAYVDFALSHPQHYRLMFMTPTPQHAHSAENLASRGKIDEDAYAFLRATMAQAIEEKRVRPEYKDADLLAQMAWAPVHGVLALHVAKKMEPEWIEARPPRETAQALIDAFIRGITKEA
jgi:AcrR family transcriptional regulator